jgi:hypothetical protein
VSAHAVEEGHLELLRRRIEEAYFDHATGCGGSFWMSS